MSISDTVSLETGQGGTVSVGALLCGVAERLADLLLRHRYAGVLEPFEHGAVDEIGTLR